MGILNFQSLERCAESFDDKLTTKKFPSLRSAQRMPTYRIQDKI
jgi:hypothetical protein